MTVSPCAMPPAGCLGEMNRAASGGTGAHSRSFDVAAVLAEDVRGGDGALSETAPNVLAVLPKAVLNL